MSADGWATCPRCKARGEIGLRGQTFREDYELGLNDPDAWGEDEQDQAPVIILNYSGECQTCGLAVKIRERFPVPGMEPEVNKPTGFVVTKAWSAVPAGWFVRANVSGRWFEVLKTERVGDYQNVLIRFPDGREGPSVRPREDEVSCRRGTLAPSSVEAALDALNAGGLTTEILDDQA